MLTLVPSESEKKEAGGAYGKTIISGVLKCHGKVHTEVVPDCSKATLQAIIHVHTVPDAIIHYDGWRGYDGSVDIGFDKHFRVHHGDNEFATSERHVDGIESFWSFAKGKNSTACPIISSTCT